MIRYVVVGLLAGFLFGVMDGLINGNPYARRLYKVYKPIARDSVNITCGITINLMYGIVMAGVFLLLRDSLPGDTNLMKGSATACWCGFSESSWGLPGSG